MSRNTWTTRVLVKHRFVAGAAVALLAGGTMIGAAGAANAAGTTSGSAPAASAPATSSGHAHAARHRPNAALRGAVRAVLAGTPHSADRAAVAAIELVDFRPKLLAKLPANLQSDLKTLAAASAEGRAGDVGRIKAAALDGTYGAQVKRLFTRIQGNLAKAASHAGA